MPCGCERPDPPIRPFRVSDINDSIDLWRAMPGLGLSDADEPEALAIFLSMNPTTSLVIEGNGRILGTVLGGSDGRRGYVYHLAIHPSYQGRGWGKVLLDACLRAFGEKGIQKVHLFVLSDNDNAVAFYDRCGWTRRNGQIEVFSMSLDPGDCAACGC